MSHAKPRWALVKPPPDSFFRALSSHPDSDKIDPTKAMRQHLDLQETLEPLVDKLVVLKKNELHPDSCFTQDAAFVFGDVALMARSGIGIRNSEMPAVKRALARMLGEVHDFPPPGTIEGGDVVRVGRTLVVGRSRRTSDHGIDFFTKFVEPLGYRVTVTDVPSHLVHLSTGVTVIHDRIALGLPEVLRAPAFGGLEQIPVLDERPDACNVLVLGDHIITSGDYPAHAVLERKGYTLHRMDLGEFVKADGGPTCLALVPIS